MEFMRIVYANQINNSRTVKILNNKDRSIYKQLCKIVDLGLADGEFRSDLTADELVDFYGSLCAV